jgi:hypothetical protein
MARCTSTFYGSDPCLTVRTAGSFHMCGGRDPIIVGGWVYRSAGREELLEVWDDSTVLAVGDASDRLCWGMRDRVDQPLRFNPLTLVETTYLFAEFAHRLFSTLPDSPAVMFVLSLYRMQAGGRRALLTPHGRRTQAFRFRMGILEAPEENAEFWFAWPAGIAPDSAKIAYGLLQRLYRWFGFTDDEVPYVEERPDGHRIISRDRIIEDGRQP